MKADEGYDILIDGQPRSFRDLKATAYEAAAFLKLGRNGGQKVEILDRTTGERVWKCSRTAGRCSRAGAAEAV